MSVTAISHEVPPANILDIIKDVEIALRLRLNKKQSKDKKCYVTHYNTGGVHAFQRLDSTDVVLQEPIKIGSPEGESRQLAFNVSLSHITYMQSDVGPTQVCVFKTVTPSVDPSKPPTITSKTRSYYKSAAQKTDRSYKVVYRDMRVLADDVLLFLMDGVLPE
jgi:hypothetical protein